MRRFSDRPTLHTLTEINVTPLLDLAFVLLVIFIITTPLMENSVNLVVPSSGEATQSVDRSQVQTISIDKDNVLRLNDEVVEPAALEAVVPSYLWRFRKAGQFTKQTTEDGGQTTDG